MSGAAAVKSEIELHAATGSTARTKEVHLYPYELTGIKYLRDEGKKKKDCQDGIRVRPFSVNAPSRRQS